MTTKDRRSWWRKFPDPDDDSQDWYHIWEKTLAYREEDIEYDMGMTGPIFGRFRVPVDYVVLQWDEDGVFGAFQSFTALGRYDTLEKAQDACETDSARFPPVDANMPEFKLGVSYGD